MSSGELTPRSLELEENRLASLTERVGILNFLWLNAAIWFGLTPLLLLVSWSTSTCEGGTPTYVYILPFGLCILSLVAEIRVVAQFRQHSGAQDIHVELLHTAYLKTDRQIITKMLDSWILLFAFSRIQMLQSGKVHACEAMHDTMQDTYDAAWDGWGPVESIVGWTHLSGLYLTMLCIGTVMQAFCFGRAFLKFRSVVSCEAGTVGGLINSESVTGLPDAWLTVAEAADAVGANYVAQLYLEGVAEITSSIIGGDGGAREFRSIRHSPSIGDFGSMEGSGSSRETRVWRGILLNVWCEGAPSIFLAVRFLNMSFEITTYESKTKAFFLMLIVGLTCLRKAVKCIWLGRVFSILTGVSILLMLFVSAVKVFYCFVCPSHYFNLIGWYCVPPV